MVSDRQYSFQNHHCPWLMAPLPFSLLSLPSPPPPPLSPAANGASPSAVHLPATIPPIMVDKHHDPGVFDLSPDQTHPSSDQADPSQLIKCDYLFPVSSSPLDLLTMLTRMASFTGMLLGVLSPKLRQSTVAHGNYKVCRGGVGVGGATVCPLTSLQECGSEVASARRQASQQLRFTEDMRSGMLRKLHKVFLWGCGLWVA